LIQSKIQASSVCIQLFLFCIMLMGNLKHILKKKIEEQGISAHALEKMAGLKPSAVQNILYGRSKNPSILTIKAIADALGCEITTLIDIPESAKKEPTPNHIWDQELYLECSTACNESLHHMGMSFSKDAILNIIDETYHYTVSNTLKKPDKNFIRWIIEKTNKS